MGGWGVCVFISCFLRLKQKPTTPFPMATLQSINKQMGQRDSVVSNQGEAFRAGGDPLLYGHFSVEEAEAMAGN